MSRGLPLQIMLYTITPANKLPPPEAIVWRYLDFPKFISMLELKQMPLARSDTFDDPYEGHWSKPTIAKLYAHSLSDQASSSTAGMILRQPNTERVKHFISCWHVNEHESAAMWKLYVGSGSGIAIKSTYGALTDEISKSNISACIVKVEYLDYLRQETPSDTSYDPYYHKRISFKHEEELRVIAWASHSKK